MDTLTFITFNLEFDGGPDEGGELPERWRQAHELLASRRPDVVHRQEMTHSRADGRARLHAAEQVLGMRGFLGPAGRGQHPTGIFIRPETFTVTREYERVWRSPPTNIITTLNDVPDVPIIMVSWHNTPSSPCLREEEADDLSGLVGVGRHGGWIGSGDCNEYPAPDGETVAPIDWDSDEVWDRPHVMARTNPGPDGTRVSCTYLDRKLLGSGLHDPARYAAHTLRQRSALDATAGHAPLAAGQGGPSRIDRWYLDPWLVQAVKEVNVLDTSEFSDHHAVEVVLDRRKAAAALRREFDPLRPAQLAATAMAEAGP
ncbi:endonuclease/exonuclease/phosphatase family protein [Streptomyces sp. FXJ1.4098]|nr:endonuclease/exonuclease/phosphatase family protein [Streptomyces sp. FXJ1.4098]